MSGCGSRLSPRARSCTSSSPAPRSERQSRARARRRLRARRLLKTASPTGHPCSPTMCGTPGWETKTPDSARGQVCTRCTCEEKLQSEFEISAEPSLDPKRFSFGPPRCSRVTKAEPRGVVVPVPGCEGVGTRAPDEDDLQGEPATACSRWTPPPRTPWARKKGATRKRGCLKSIKREDMGQLYATRARDPTDLPSAEVLARAERLDSGHGYLMARFGHNMKIPASDSPSSLPPFGREKPNHEHAREAKSSSTQITLFLFLAVPHLTPTLSPLVLDHTLLYELMELRFFDSVVAIAVLRNHHVNLASEVERGYRVRKCLPNECVMCVASL